MKIIENHQLLMECPICNTRHYVHIIKKESRITIKDKEVIYPETIYMCGMGNEDLSFVPEKTAKENTIAAKKAYKDIYEKKEKPPSETEKLTEEQTQKMPEA